MEWIIETNYFFCFEYKVLKLKVTTTKSCNTAAYNMYEIM